MYLPEFADNQFATSLYEYRFTCFRAVSSRSNSVATGRSMSGSLSSAVYPNGIVLAMRGTGTHSSSSFKSVGCGSFHFPAVLLILYWPSKYCSAISADAPFTSLSSHIFGKTIWTHIILASLLDTGVPINELHRLLRVLWAA